MNTTVLRHPISQILHGAAPRIERRAVPRDTTCDPHLRLIARATAVLQRWKRLDAQSVIAFPATMVEHMYAGVREWTDSEPAPARTSFLLDALANSTLAPSPRIRLGSHW